MAADADDRTPREWAREEPEAFRRVAERYDDPIPAPLLRRNVLLTDYAESTGTRYEGRLCAECFGQLTSWLEGGIDD